VPERWAVVGGGMLGMALAAKLAEAGNDVTLLERSVDLGGLAASWQVGDVVWDRHYHVILSVDSALLTLLEDLDLDVRWRTTRTGLYAGGELHSVSSTAEYLRLPVLGPMAKARIGLTMLAASRRRDWGPLEEMTAEQWLIRWSGTQAYQSFWRPLLRSKLGDLAEQASAAFIWAVLRRLYSARRSGAKREMLGFVPGGYAVIIDAMGEALRAAGVTMQTGAEVRSVVSDDWGVVVTTATTGPATFDRVVVTAAAPVAARLVPQLTDRERQRCADVAYMGIVCPSVVLDRPLGGFYTTNITDSGLPFTGVIEMSALVDDFAGATLAYLPRYIPADDPLLGADDDAIVDQFLGGLRTMFPDLAEGSVRAARVSRVRYVLPVPTVGYSRRLPPMRTSVRGVSLVNSAHIVNGTLNVDETLRLADGALTVITEPRPVARLP